MLSRSDEVIRVESETVSKKIKTNQYVRVGIGVFVKKNDKILLGKRIGSHGAGEWSLPGGHLEFGETWEDCAIREVKEETGLLIKNISYGWTTNDIFVKEIKHYVTIFMNSEYKSGKLTLNEPDKCEKWDWFTVDNLPDPLFLPVKNYFFSS